MRGEVKWFGWFWNAQLFIAAQPVCCTESGIQCRWQKKCYFMNLKSNLLEIVFITTRIALVGAIVCNIELIYFRVSALAIIIRAKVTY